MATFHVTVEIFKELIAYITVKIFKIVYSFLQRISLSLINNRVEILSVMKCDFSFQHIDLYKRLKIYIYATWTCFDVYSGGGVEGMIWCGCFDAQIYSPGRICPQEILTLAPCQWPSGSQASRPPCLLLRVRLSFSICYKMQYAFRQVTLVPSCTKPDTLWIQRRALPTKWSNKHKKEFM